MKIAIDAMGGDYAPQEIIKGTCDALREFNEIEQIFLVGDENAITPLIEDDVREKIEIIHTTEIIGMDEHPAQAYRSKKNASISIASRLVKEEKADAVVSAGSTGAQLVTGLFEIGRIKNIKRPAIAVQLPSLNEPKVLIDSGANTEVTVENLHQFALMGQVLASVLNPNKKNISVGLINNGSEESKGGSLQQEAYQILKNDSKLNFHGNIEGNEIMSTNVDVFVCDGFTGNIILKTMEGMGKAFFSILKKSILSSFRYKLGALFLKPAFAQIAKDFDAKEVGGSPLVGIKGVSIVCHGNSNAYAFSNGIKMAINCVNNNLVDKITKIVSEE